MTKRNNPGDFKKGHQLWRLRNDPVKPKKFPTPESLLEACKGYFQWLDDNPLPESRAFHHQGEITKTELDKMRMPTIEGLSVFIGMSKNSWYQYAKRPKYQHVTQWVDAVIWDWRITGAAAGVLDPALISRLLGLAEKRDLTSSDGTMAPPKVIKMVPKGE